MAMKLVKKTAEYSIYRRGDARYAIKGANCKPINGDEKTRILLAEELITAALVAKPVVAETIADEVSAESADQEADAPVTGAAEDADK
jgi:hypothetical protein